MSEIRITETTGRVNQPNNQVNNNVNSLDDVDIFYTTSLEEEDRGTFSETFNLTEEEDCKTGQEFLNGLIENKETICKSLGISEEQYDILSSIALGLASQETGLGEEKGYQSENKGFGKVTRGAAKFFDVLFGGASASSGITQLKINDFMKKEFNETEVELLKSLGVKTSMLNRNNLFKEPDKAAVATIVALNSIAQKYDDYKAMLETHRKELENEFNDNLSEEERENIGSEIINNITSIYNEASNEEKSEIRNAFKDWLQAQNGSVKGQKGVSDKLNEELKLEELNEILMQNGFEEALTQSDLNYIRYFLTSDGQEMNIIEFCAYGWNKGTGTSGMKPDRTFMDKIGTILSNPEDFDYDQHTVNTTTLAEMYMQQINPDFDINYMNNAFVNYKFN